MCFIHSVKAQNKELVISCDSLNAQKTILDDGILAKRLSSANDSIKDLKEQIFKLKHDNLIFRDEITTLKQQMASAKKELSRVDTVTIQMIITYMNLKCSSRRIGILRQDFANISDAKLKKSYKKWDDLLSIYTSTYDQVRMVVCDAKVKIPTAPMPPLRDKYIQEENEVLNQLPYMSRFFHDDNCTSHYLNGMIKEAKKLFSATAKEKDYQMFLQKYPVQ